MGAPLVTARRVALTIAGSDSSGGAGVAADLKTFEAHGVWGAAALCAVTAQNTLGVQAVETVSPELVRAQIASVASDLGVDAAKTGMLGSAAVVAAVAESVVLYGVVPLVVDPVMAAGHGESLLTGDGLDALRDRLVPHATVMTPNLAEAEALLGWKPGSIEDRYSMETAALALLDLGPEVVMLTGGHLADQAMSPDCVVQTGGAPVWLESERLPSPDTHGTGCVLSAAICAELARGMKAPDACVSAKHFVKRAISAGVALGSGVGPVDPGGSPRDRR